MERPFLEEQLAAGRSLEQIGALVGKHPSTVGYWLKRHGLKAAHHDKNAPTRRVDPAELKELVALGLTAAELATELDVSTTTVNCWLRKLGLKTTRGEHRAARQQARAAGATIVPSHCRTHGEADFKLARGAYKCVLCTREAVARRRRRVKRILVAEAGGRCLRCGFSEHPAALHFHHVNPREKAFGLSSAGISRSLARSRVEAQKCILLCSNCHAMVEAGVASV